MSPLIDLSRYSLSFSFVTASVENDKEKEGRFG